MQVERLRQGRSADMDCSRISRAGLAKCGMRMARPAMARWEDAVDDGFAEGGTWSGDPFERLQRLVDLLPAMQEKGDRLALARAAQEVLEACRRHQAVRKELDDLDMRALEAVQAAKRAREEGTPASEAERLDREYLYFSAMKGFKVGPEQNAAKALAKALASGGFATVDDAQAAALSAAELEGLAAEVEDYQAAYAETLAACQQLEADEAAGRA